MKSRKVLILFFLTIISFTFRAKAQTFNYQLTGNPVNITGWTMGGSSIVNGDAITLTLPQTQQAGYIYLSEPTTLSDCAQFTVSFEFSITESSSTTADGIAFWFITNPPTTFTNGQALGLPDFPNGLVLALDTYDNEGTFNNPLISLRRYDGTVVNYVEGSTTGRLCPDVTSQSFIADGNLHTCVINYSNGNITVAFDGNAPIMTGTTDLSSLAGYFGFCASTGASYSSQSVKNVTISGNPVPPAPQVNDQTYCLDAVATPLTATGAVLHWYTSATGGTELPSAPTPNTSMPGTYTWYVSQSLLGCTEESVRAAINVIVSQPPPAPTVTYDSIYCTGDNFTSFVVNGQNPLWYDTETGGVGTATTPVITTDNPNTYTWFVSQTIDGCESIKRTKVTVVVNQTPVPDFNYTIHYGCSADTVIFDNVSLYATSYKWNFDDGSVVDTSANPTHIFFGQGIKQVKLIAIAGECIDSVVKPIDLQHPLAASFSVNDDTVCAQTPITFTDHSVTTVVNGNPPIYHWDLGDGTTNEGNAVFSHAYDEPGTYIATLTITDGVPCVDTATYTIIVDPFAEVTIDRDDSLICTGDKIDFTANFTPQGLQRIKWNFSDYGDTVIDVNPISHSYDNAGDFTISVVGQYRSCPDATDITNITVKPVPVINLGHDDSLCFHGEPLQLIDIQNAHNPDAHWLWDNGDTLAYRYIVHHGTYSAMVTIDGCTSIDEVKVYKDCYIDVPNAFTPNDDGVNDYFFPRQFLSEGVTAFKMQIFNRWGELIYETTRLDGRGWDGKLNGITQPAGVYVYIIDVTYKNNSVDHYTGNVTLLR